MKAYCNYSITVSLFFICAVRADTIGSDSAVSVQTNYNFPQNPVIFANKISTFAYMKSGFTLQNSSTACQFDSVFPVTGTLQLNGGTLTLTQDLIFTDPVTLQGLGTIIAGGHTINFSPSITSLPTNSNVFQNAILVFNNDVTINNAVSLQGACTINGRGSILTLGASGSITLAAGASVTIQNITISGLASNKLVCASSTASLVFDTVTLIQSGNYAFTTGSFQVNNQLAILGGYNFAYQSSLTSTILSQSSLILDNAVTFSYNPSTWSQNLLLLQDNTSSIVLKDATLYATLGGMTLTKGKLIIQGNSFLASEKRTTGSPLDNGITFGDGSSSSNDLLWTIFPSAQVSLLLGSINYKNVATASLKTESSTVALIIGDSTTLRLYKNLDASLGITQLNSCTLAKTNGARLISPVHIAGTVTFSSF